MLTLVSVPLTM